jgi:hypothetical protein
MMLLGLIGERGRDGAPFPASKWYASRTCKIMSGNALRWDSHLSKSPAD